MNQVWAVLMGLHHCVSQVGVRQELQDEEGAVMGMRVGERRRFAVPLDLAFKRKAFGQPVPPNQVRDEMSVECGKQVWNEWS